MKASTRAGAVTGIVLVAVAGVVLVQGGSVRAPHLPGAVTSSASGAPGATGVALVDATQPLAAPRELAEMRHELARLRAEVGALRTEAGRSAQAPSPAPEEGPSLSKDEQEAQFLKYMTDVEQRFRNEPRDHDWAEQASNSIREAAASELVPPGLVADIDCRSRTCKVELGQVDARVLGKGVDLMIAQLAQVLPNARIGHDGDVSHPKPNAIYFTRPGPEDSPPAVARQ